MSSINRETWITAREDYVRGRGSLAAVAVRHSLKKATVEKCAKRECWTKLRREFEAAQMAKLLPPAPPCLPPVPVAPGGVVSEAWLAQRVDIHYRENAALMDKARSLLTKKLADEKDLGMDGLAKLTSALGGIIAAEIAWLGLNRRKDKRRQSYRQFAEPISEPSPVQTPQVPVTSQ